MREIFLPLKRRVAKLANKCLNYCNDYSYDFEKNGEKDLIVRFSSLSPRVVFDVGAHVGNWTNIVLTHFPLATVHCFELSLTTYENLARNVNTKRAVLNKFGLSERQGSFAYKDYGANSEVNTLVLSATYHDSERAPSTLIADLRTGDTYCKGAGVEVIDFLKIDTEGADHLVLRGFERMLREAKIRLIQFEYGYTNGDSKFLMRDFYNFFEDFGYQIGRVRRGSIQFGPWTYQHNDFKSGPNYVAIHIHDHDLKRLLSGD